MADSKNGIEHKCPCCGYEVEWDWHDGGKFTKGDESFIQIQNICGETTTFLTDKPKEFSWLYNREKVVLLGCPKCRTVSFQFW